MTVDIVPAQVRAARGLIAWTQDELAQAAHVGLSTVRDFEAGRRQPMPANATAIRAALEAAGVEFIPEDGSGVGVRLMRQG